MRSWQRDLDRGVDTELTRRILAQAAASSSLRCYDCHEPIDAGDRCAECTATFTKAPLRSIESGDGSPISFHTSDGRYFDNERDRRSHQQLLDERAARHAERCARVAARETETSTSDAMEVA